MPAKIPVSPEVIFPELPYYKFAKQKWSRFPDKIAFIDAFSDEALSYAELERRVEKAAGWLQKLGVSSQSSVQFYTDNCTNGIVLQNAAYFCNATLFSFKPNKTTKYEEYKYQIEDSKAEFVLTDGVNYDVAVHQLLQDPDCQVKKVVILNGMPTNPVDPSKVIFFDNLGNHDFVPPKVNVKEDVIIVSYTSGSTGKPKGAMHTHFSFIASLHLMGPQVEKLIIESDRFLLISTLTYVTGMIFSAGTFAAGGSVILASHDIDPELPVYVEKYKATVLVILEVGVRTATAEAHRFPNLRRMMKSMRLVLASGTVFPENLRSRASEFFKGAKITNIFGMTESIGIICKSEPSDVCTSDIGTPCTNCQVRIISSKTGLPIDVGETGDFQFLSPNITVGYWGLGKQDFTEDGWFSTGDLATVDDQGKIYIVGRLKQFIICLDERVSPTEIENLLLVHPAVAEVIVVAVPHPVVQEAPTAMVILNQGYSPSKQLEQELIDLVASKTVENKHLYGGVLFIDSLDKTESGKYARNLIKQKAELLRKF